jgi:hypothetical protein
MENYYNNDNKYYTQPGRIQYVATLPQEVGADSGGDPHNMVWGNALAAIEVQNIVELIESAPGSGEGVDLRVLKNALYFFNITLQLQAPNADQNIDLDFLAKIIIDRTIVGIPTPITLSESGSRIPNKGDDPGRSITTVTLTGLMYMYIGEMVRVSLQDFTNIGINILGSSFFINCI